MHLSDKPLGAVAVRVFVCLAWVRRRCHFRDSNVPVSDDPSDEPRGVFRALHDIARHLPTVGAASGRHLRLGGYGRVPVLQPLHVYA